MPRPTRLSCRTFAANAVFGCHQRPQEIAEIISERMAFALLDPLLTSIPKAVKKSPVKVVTSFE